MKSVSGIAAMTAREEEGEEEEGKEIEKEKKKKNDNAKSYGKIFSLSSALALSLSAKFAIFIVGTAVMGFLATRGQLPACGSNTSSPIQIFGTPYGDAEAYTDYRDLYLRCLVNPFLSGKGAYNLPIVYNYPPLFLYLLSAFAELQYIWAPAVPLVFFDALTVVPLYLAARDFIFHGNQKLAFAVSLVWIFNPLNMFYNDLMWLNPGITTFFLMLSVYFLLKKSWMLSSISLAISTGFKQTAVLLFPIFLVWLIRSPGLPRKKVQVTAFALLYVGAMVLISTPYIFTDTQVYFWALQLPILGNPPGASPGYPTTFEYDLSQPTRLTTFLGLIQIANLKSFAVSSYYVLNDVFVAAYILLLIHLAIGLQNIRKAALYTGALLRTIFLSRRPTGFKEAISEVHLPQEIATREISATNLLIYCLTAMLLFLSLFGRGSYKYYFAGITPLALPLFSKRIGAIIFEVFSIALIILPREVTPWFAILMLTLVPNMLANPRNEQTLTQEV